MGDERELPTAEETATSARGESLVLTVDEAAELLRVDRKTIYAAVKRGQLPGVRRIGGVIRLCRTSLLEWLSTGHGRDPAQGSPK